MVALVVHALRARARPLVAQLPAAAAPALGVTQDQVRVYVVELDHTADGCLVVVYGSCRIDVPALARAVGDIQGTDDVVVQHVVTAAG